MANFQAFADNNTDYQDKVDFIADGYQAIAAWLEQV